MKGLQSEGESFLAVFFFARMWGDTLTVVLLD